MSGGGGGRQSSAQTAEPWSEAQPFLRQAYGMAQTAANATSTAPFGGNFVTQANPAQWDALAGLRRFGQQNQGSGDGAISLANRTLAGDFVNNNPNLQRAIDATVRPTVQRATDEIMPAIGSAAQRAGAFGGSRQAFLEGKALDSVNTAVADTAAKMWADNYGLERQLQVQAPQMLAAGQGLNQNAINALLGAAEGEYALNNLSTQNDLARFEDSINRHWRAVNPYIAALGGAGMPGGTTTMESRGGSSALAGVLSGAAGGGALGMMAGGAGMLPFAMGGPGGLAAGAALGALMGGIR